MTKDTILTLTRASTKIPLAPSTSGSAGIDISSAESQIVTIYPEEIKTINTGLKAAIPTGWCGLIFPRSSTGVSGMWLANTTGVIDSDYRGTILVKIKNTSEDRITIKPFDRIAQLVIIPHFDYSVVTEADTLDETERGAGGFGSTGTGIDDSGGGE